MEGVYEAELTGLLCRLAAPKTWYFDVGANIGLMSVPVLAHCKEVKVRSYEPSPNAAPFLLETWKRCPWRDRWCVSDKAVSDKKGEAEFSYGESGLGGYDGLLHTNRVRKVGAKKVELTTLDDDWRSLGCPTVSVMKFDIEGAELLALKGALSLLRECRPTVIVEWYEENLIPYGIKAEDILAFSREHDFELISIPTMSVVNSKTILSLLMHTTSAFMLAPKDA